MKQKLACWSNSSGLSGRGMKLAQNDSWASTHWRNVGLVARTAAASACSSSGIWERMSVIHFRGGGGGGGLGFGLLAGGGPLQFVPVWPSETAKAPKSKISMAK